jgi:hypothetical protein
MPRTVKQILDHADKLAKRFEDFEPIAEDERDRNAAIALRNAAASRSEAERSITAAVESAERTAIRGSSSVPCSALHARLPARGTDPSASPETDPGRLVRDRVASARGVRPCARLRRLGAFGSSDVWTRLRASTWRAGEQERRDSSTAITDTVA